MANKDQDTFLEMEDELVEEASAHLVEEVHLGSAPEAEKKQEALKKEGAESKSDISGKVVLKSTLWYTISTFLFRSVAFFTTPIIVRVLTKSQYGEFNNMQSWIGFVVIFVGLGLSSTIIRAKLDFKEKIDSYAFSMLTLDTLFTTLVFAVLWFFRAQVSEITAIPESYFFIAYLYILFNQAYSIFCTRERAHYRYKGYSLLTGLMIVFYSLFTVFLVLNMENKLDAIVYGNYIPYVVVGTVLYFLLFKDGKRPRFEHYKYGLKLGLPLLPHAFSMVLLSSSSRIIITRLIGSAETALFSLSSVIPNIVSVLLNAMNEAWAPWFLDTLHAGDTKSVNKISCIYFGTFFLMIVGVMLVAPEVVYILGGEKYVSGLSMVPALISGCVFQFAYSMYVQVEFYEKKMTTVSTATAFAALVNIALNLLLIPLFGYQVAAYAILGAYAVLFCMHFITACRFGYRDIFDLRVILGGLALSLLLIPIMLVLYEYSWIRYPITLVFGSGVLWYLYTNKAVILKLMRKK